MRERPLRVEKVVPRKGVSYSGESRRPGSELQLWVPGRLVELLNPSSTWTRFCRGFLLVIILIVGDGLAAFQLCGVVLLCVECRERLGDIGEHIWEVFNDAFEYLPLACLIEDSIFCIHGGIGADIHAISDLAVSPLRPFFCAAVLV